MSLDPDQRRLLGAFLRARREALPPPVAAQRRRTPGLRREEVAQLCGVSTSWYTWLEQGREIALSAPALGRLATALNLTLPERAYLFDLAQCRDPRDPGEAVGADGPPPWKDLVNAIGAPAYALDALWTAIAWNRAAEHLFIGWLGGEEPNLLRYIFLAEGAKTFIADWEDRARRVVAEFRADLGHRPHDEAMQALIGDLRQTSATFATLWDTHRVLARDGGLRTFHHPSDGLVRFHQTTLLPATDRDRKIVVLLPRN